MICPHCETEFEPPAARTSSRLFCPGCGRDLSQSDMATGIVHGAGPPTHKEGELSLDALLSDDGDGDDGVVDGSGSIQTTDGPPPCMGPYRIEKELGRGGMGVVYLAKDSNLGRKAALKVLPPSLASDAEFRERFRREAASASKLEHPGIVQVYGVGEDHGALYMAMQYVEGSTLRGADLSVEESARTIRDVARALAFAHDSGVIHRDIKPENIMLRAVDRAPLVMDFGLAREEANQGLTKSGQVLGTPAYMSPEQARSQRDIDGRTDVYSLGASLYELLADRRVFEAQELNALLFQVLTEDPVPLRRLRNDIPRDLETVVMKCLEKDRENRYATAADLAADLDRFLAGEPVLAKPIGALPRTIRKLRKRPLAVVASFVAIVAMATAGGLTFRARIMQDRALNEEQQRFEVQRTRGENALREKNYPLAEEAFSAALGIRPWAAEIRFRRDAARVETLVERGRRALADKAYPSALADFEKALQLDPARRDLGPLLRRARRIGRLIITGWNDEQASAAAVRAAPFSASADTAPLQFAGPGPFDLSQGDWTVTVEMKGCETLRFPVRVEAETDREIEVRALPEGSVPEGMVFVPGASFVPGDPASGGKAVRLGPYFLDRTEVTVLQFLEFVKAAKTPEEKAWRTPSTWKGEGDWPDSDEMALPVTGVTFGQAYEYARWAGKHLPSAMEWERAARGEDGRAFPWGDVFDRSRCHSPVTGGPDPVNVGLFREWGCPFGALDMAGNAAEWTCTELVKEGAYAGEGRILVKGGSWKSTGPDALKTYVFETLGQWDDRDDVGFRCAKYAPRAEAGAPRSPPGPEDQADLTVELVVDRHDGLLVDQRLPIVNTQDHAAEAWPLTFPFFTRIDSIEDGQGRALAFEDSEGMWFQNRQVRVRFSEPLAPGETRRLCLRGRSTLLGNPFFQKRFDRARIKYELALKEGQTGRIRLVLPEAAREVAATPAPASRQRTARGLELTWRADTGSLPPPQNIMNELCWRTRIDVRYRLEGADLRLADQRAFVAERKASEAGEQPIDVERMVSRYSKHYASEQGAGIGQIENTARQWAKIYSKTVTGLDIRAVELYDGYATSVDMTSFRIIDKKGVVVADSEETPVWILFRREEGAWKRLTQRSLVQADLGSVEEGPTYVNARFRCRLGPAPGWTMTINGKNGAFQLVATKPEYPALKVILGGTPQPKGTSLDGFVKNQVQAMEAVCPEFEILRQGSTTLAGHSAEELVLRLVADLGGGMRGHIWQHMIFLERNRSLFVYVVYAMGESVQALDEMIEKARPETDALGETLRLE